MLTRRLNAMWNILLMSEGEARSLAESIPTTKLVRMQTEYMDTGRSKIPLHRVLMDVEKDHVGAFFTNMSRSMRSRQ